MNKCTRCGSDLFSGSRYCHACGTSVGGGEGVLHRTELSSNVAAALSYSLGLITGVIFLNLDPYRQDRNVRFHAWQSIFFCLSWMVLSMLNGIFSFGSFYLGVLTPFVGLAFMVLWVLLIVKAYNGDTFRIPLLSDWADKQASKI